MILNAALVNFNSHFSVPIKEKINQVTLNTDEEGKTTDTEKKELAQPGNKSKCNKISADNYLCSVESVLSVTDILTILDDANVSHNGISFVEPNGDFRVKKFYTVKYDKPSNFFKLKISFNKSYLNGEWFLTAKPPKNIRKNSPTPQNCIPSQNIDHDH